MVLTRERPLSAPAGASARPRQSVAVTDIVRAVDAQDMVLTARLAAGDEEALAEVWQRYGPLVFGLASRVTGDAATAEDVAQEVFVTLWQQPERFDATRGTLRAFLGVHAQRRAIDALRRDGRRIDREHRHHRLHDLRHDSAEAHVERADSGECGARGDQAASLQSNARRSSSPFSAA